MLPTTERLGGVLAHSQASRAAVSEITRAALIAMARKLPDRLFNSSSWQDTARRITRRGLVSSSGANSTQDLAVENTFPNTADKILNEQVINTQEFRRQGVFNNSISAFRSPAAENRFSEGILPERFLTQSRSFSTAPASCLRKLNGSRNATNNQCNMDTSSFHHADYNNLNRRSFFTRSRAFGVAALSQTEASSSFSAAATGSSSSAKVEPIGPATSGSSEDATGSANMGMGSPKKGSRKSRSSGFVGPACFLLGSGAIAGAIVYQDEIIEFCDEKGIANFFEDFNEISRDFLMDMGDYLVPPKPAPWLLDFETLKYPPHLPTLVLDLDKVVCRLEFDRMTGWQVRKRPGADQFFNELQHYYEIVIFSDDMFPVAADVIQRWNVPVGGVLHREFCRRKRKHFVKDIGKLGRNLERVIHIEHDPVSASVHPENAICIPEYTGDENDTALLDLIEFLKAAMHQQDVREFLKKYGGDGDVGKRYLLEKHEREQLVNKRRGMGRGFGAGRGVPRTDPMGRKF